MPLQRYQCAAVDGLEKKLTWPASRSTPAAATAAAVSGPSAWAADTWVGEEVEVWGAGTDTEALAAPNSVDSRWNASAHCESVGSLRKPGCG